MIIYFTRHLNRKEDHRASIQKTSVTHIFYQYFSGNDYDFHFIRAD